MPDEQGRPVRGEVGHPYYRKDLSKGLKFDKKGILISQGPPELGMTDTNTQGLKGSDLPKTPAGTPDPRGIYTESVAKGFNKNEQINLLKARKVRVIRRDTEKTLVAKILDSNPKGDKKDKDVVDEPDVPPKPEEETTANPPNYTKDVPPKPEEETTANPPNYTNEELNDFKSSALVKILKNLFGVKKIPLTAKGRIKKILELQK